MPREEKRGKLGWKLIRRLNGKQDYKMDRAPYPVQSIGPPPIPSSQSCTTTQHPAEYHSLYLKIGFRFSDGLLRMKAFWQKNAEEIFFISEPPGCSARVFWTKENINYQKNRFELHSLCQLFIKCTELKQVRWTICFICSENVIFKMQNVMSEKVQSYLLMLLVVFSNFYWHGKEKSLL